MQESGDQAAEAAVARAHSPSLGARLRSAREAKELGLEKIADELRIEAHVLRALEEDRLGDIPVAPVFVKGYIKQYSRQLGLDYNELRAVYLEQIGSDEVDLLPSQSIQLRDERQITIWIIAGLVLLLLGVFLFVWWLGGDARSPSVTVTRPGVESRASDPPASLLGSPAAAPASPAAAGTAPEREGVVAAAAALEPAPAAMSSAAGVEPAETGSVTTPAGGARITLRFREESWAEITAGDDRRLYYDLAGAGTELSFNAAPPLRLLLGNADGVDVSVDGQPFAIPRQGRRGNTATFVVPAAAD